MFIKSISSNIMDRFGKPCHVTTNYGKFKNTSIAIETISRDGKPEEKQYIFWDKVKQILIRKQINKEGKWEKV